MLELILALHMEFLPAWEYFIIDKVFPLTVPGAISAVPLSKSGKHGNMSVQESCGGQCAGRTRNLAF